MKLGKYAELNVRESGDWMFAYLRETPPSHHTSLGDAGETRHMNINLCFVFGINQSPKLLKGTTKIVQSFLIIYFTEFRW